MYATHYLQPERKWGVFKNNIFVKSFDTHKEAEEWIKRQVVL